MEINLERRFIAQAMESLRPNSEFSVGETYESLKWISSNQVKPTEKEFNDAIEAEKIAWSNSEYARNRQAEFPSIQDLVVALYDTDDKSAVEAKRASVKAKYPKP